jgi:hypothetical protein
MGHPIFVLGDLNCNVLNNSHEGRTLKKPAMNGPFAL